MIALRTITRRLRLTIRAVLLAVALVLLTLLGLITVVIPAAWGILVMELARVARWFRQAPGSLVGKNPAR